MLAPISQDWCNGQHIRLSTGKQGFDSPVLRQNCSFSVSLVPKSEISMRPFITAVDTARLGIRETKHSNMQSSLNFATLTVDQLVQVTLKANNEKFFPIRRYLPLACQPG